MDEQIAANSSDSAPTIGSLRQFLPVRISRATTARKANGTGRPKQRLALRSQLGTASPCVQAPLEEGVRQAAVPSAGGDLSGSGSQSTGSRRRSPQQSRRSFRARATPTVQAGSVRQALRDRRQATTAPRALPIVRPRVRTGGNPQTTRPSNHCRNNNRRISDGTGHVGNDARSRQCRLDTIDGIRPSCRAHRQQSRPCSWE